MEDFKQLFKRYKKTGIICLIILLVSAIFFTLTTKNKIERYDSPVKYELSEKQIIALQDELAEFTGIDKEALEHKMDEPVQRKKGKKSVDVTTPQGLYRITFTTKADGIAIQDAIKI